MRPIPPVLAARRSSPTQLPFSKRQARVLQLWLWPRVGACRNKSCPARRCRGTAATLSRTGNRLNSTNRPCTAAYSRIRATSRCRLLGTKCDRGASASAITRIMSRYVNVVIPDSGQRSRKPAGTLMLAHTTIARPPFYAINGSLMIQQIGVSSCQNIQKSWLRSISARIPARSCKRARAVASSAAAQLHIIHVIEPLSFAYGGDIPMDFSGIQDEIYQQATQQLERFAEEQQHRRDPPAHCNGQAGGGNPCQGQGARGRPDRGRQPRPLMAWRC